MDILPVITSSWTDGTNSNHQPPGEGRAGRANLKKEKYTPEQVIRAITDWTYPYKYGLHTKAGKLLGVNRQRIRTMTTQGRRGVIPIVLLRLLMAAQQEGILSDLIERMKKIEIETEENHADDGV